MTNNCNMLKSLTHLVEEKSLITQVDKKLELRGGYLPRSRVNSPWLIS